MNNLKWNEDSDYPDCGDNKWSWPEGIHVSKTKPNVKNHPVEPFPYDFLRIHEYVRKNDEIMFSLTLIP